jgi:phage shock protein A
MEEALQQEQQQLKRLQHEKQQLQRRLQGLQHNLEQSEEELDICFKSGKEELARSIIKRRLQSERLGKLLAQQEEALDERIKQLTPRIEQNSAELEGMRQKAELLASEQPESHLGKAAEEIGISISEDEVEVAFLREKQRRAQS